MDSREQHRKNAAREKRWIADAERDKAELNKEGSYLWAHGRRIEAGFDFQEAENAGSWIGKRKRIMGKEERLGR